MTPNSPSFTLFIVASIALNLSPGPDMLYVATRSATQGLRAGVISALGIFSGCLVHISFAIFGVSVILERSATAFMVVKYAGAAYLIWLGVVALVTRSPLADPSGNQKMMSYSRVYISSVLTNVLNPKVAMFFLAFLPQFVNPLQGHSAFRILGLGLYFDIQGALVLIGVATLVSRVGRAWLSHPRVLPRARKVGGGIMIALGIRLAFLDKG